MRSSQAITSEEGFQGKGVGGGGGSHLVPAFWSCHLARHWRWALSLGHRQQDSTGPSCLFVLASLPPPEQGLELEVPRHIQHTSSSPSSSKLAQVAALVSMSSSKDVVNIGSGFLARRPLSTSLSWVSEVHDGCAL